MTKEEFIKRYGEEAYKRNRELSREKTDLWFAKNRDRLLETGRVRYKKYRKKMKNDPLYRFKLVFYTMRRRYYDKVNSNG